MGLFFDVENKRKWIYQPNFSRTRHRYRGDRQSGKVNLEISQFLYDINNINKKLDEFIKSTIRYASYISRGMSVDSASYTGTNSGNVMGLLELSSAIEGLRNRVQEMEQKHV